MQTKEETIKAADELIAFSFNGMSESELAKAIVERMDNKEYMLNAIEHIITFLDDITIADDVSERCIKYIRTLVESISYRL